MNSKIPALFTLIKGIIMALLGSIHIAAFFIIPDKIFAIPIPSDFYEEYTVWFNLAGVLFIYIGINDIQAYKGLKKNIIWARKTALSSAIVSMAFSFVGILTFREWPPYVIFAISVLQFIPLIWFANSKESDITKAT